MVFIYYFSHEKVCKARNITYQYQTKHTSPLIKILDAASNLKCKGQEDKVLIFWK